MVYNRFEQTIRILLLDKHTFFGFSCRKMQIEIPD
jgi:hypothetical protein